MSLGAVSYTHLDVYKRQTQYLVSSREAVTTQFFLTHHPERDIFFLNFRRIKINIHWLAKVSLVQAILEYASE